MKQIVVLGGGISGYGSAILAKKKGFGVFLSDAGRIADRYKAKLDEWEVPYEEGGHTEERILAATEVVKSPGIPDTAPMVRKIREAGIPVISEMEFAGRYMGKAKCICITGSNGKTTTTSLTAAIFDVAGKDPTVIIGGRLNAYGANARLGEGEYLIAEADESDGSFLCLFPIVNVVTNVDMDHVDFYAGQKEIDEAFVTFMNKVPFYGANVVCGDDPGVRRLLPQVKRRVVTYGFGKDNALRAEVTSCAETSVFTVFLRGGRLGEVHLGQPGRHNILNALAAIGVALEAGISPEHCIEGLARFGGVGRRFERRGERDGVTVVDDYGHHPVEIAATLATARSVYPDRRLVVVFQPHRFSRTQALFGEFCKVFEPVDKLLLTEIYPASEKPIPGVSGQSLAQGIRQVSNTDVTYYQSFDEILAALPGVLRPGDVLLTLGAGSVTTIGQRYVAGE